MLVGDQIKFQPRIPLLIVLDVTPEAAKNRVKYSFPQEANEILGGRFRFLRQVEADFPQRLRD